ncbi:oligosaccharide flippase family protein [Streptomyces sp. NBC_00094]|uniref:oligosaccharide flippase family protein n=1 Tax=Streptomyces sp. NBC_00094 TaxID=2903620 RepID=UPI002255CEA2|nr:oligosaccharide flippase family protein [Streptomyces sp. NBC_00094]MCX5388862.1 oligosaccharide flippase family protein [Streptomyces sp. NBC_00094]
MPPRHLSPFALTVSAVRTARGTHRDMGEPLSKDTAAPEARTTLVALGWNYASAIAATVLQLCYTAYTARVVLPESFGAFAAAAAATTVLGYVAGAGLATYLLRAEELTRQTVRCAYRVSMLSGVLCCAVSQAVAPLAAAVWGLPEVAPMVQLYGVYFLTQPASQVAVAALRRLDQARFCAVTETVAQFAGMVVGAGLLGLGWSPYGLVVAQVMTPSVTLAVAAVWLARLPLADGPHVPPREMLRISGAFAGYGMIQMTAADVTLLAVTRFLGPAAAGQFSRTTLAVGLPVAVLCQSLRRAVMPSLARINGGGRRLGTVLPDVLSATSAVAFATFGVLAGVGPAALALLLGPGWEAAGALVPVLAAGAPLVLLCQVSYAADEIRREMGSLLQTQLLVLAATVVFVGLAVVAGQGMALVAVAASVAAGVGHLEQLVRWHRTGLCHMSAIVRPYAVHAAVGAALYGSGYLAAGYGNGPLARVAHGLLGMVPVALVCVVLRRRLPLYAAAVSRGLITGRAG